MTRHDHVPKEEMGLVSKGTGRTDSKKKRWKHSMKKGWPSSARRDGPDSKEKGVDLFLNIPKEEDRDC
jgi:hypothetical protein